jgi:hypothetical protein
MYLHRLSSFICTYIHIGRTRWRSTLRHYAVSRKITGSVPDEVVELSIDINASSRTMALGSTQPLTEIFIRNIPGGKGRPELKADNFTAVCESNVLKIWEPRRLTNLWVSMACYRDSFTFVYTVYTCTKCFDNSVGVAIGYGLNGPGLIPSLEKFFSPPRRPDRL